MGLLGGHAFELVMVLFSCILLLMIAGIWLWGVVEVATKERVGDEDKIVWLLIVLLVPGVGTIIYYLLRRPSRLRMYDR